MGTILVAERFCGGITEAEKRQLFDEHVAWYRMYGMSMRPVPKTWEDFQVYWDHMCRNVLEDNRATREVLALENYGKPWFMRRVPDAMFGPMQRHVVAPVMRWLCIGLYDPSVRDLLGLFVVGPRRMAAPPVVHRCPNDVLALAETCAQASACSCRPRQSDGPDTGRRSVAADTRRAICRRWTGAASRCTTARTSEPVHIAPSK